MSRWRRGDFCRVAGEGSDIFRVREVRKGEWQSADLDNLTGTPTNHGHEALSKLTRVTPREALKVARVHRAIAGALDPKEVAGLEQMIADLRTKLAAAEACSTVLAEEVNTAEDRTRAQIVAFIAAKADRINADAGRAPLEEWIRLNHERHALRIIAEQIAQGEDHRNGGEQ